MSLFTTILTTLTAGKTRSFVNCFDTLYLIEESTICRLTADILIYERFHRMIKIMFVCHGNI